MEEAITPIVEYKDSDKDPLNYVIVKVDIEGLKKSRMSDTPANATIDFDVKERSFSLAVEVLNKKKDLLSQRYLFKVQELPAEINPSSSATFYKVKKGEVVIHLKKNLPGSWSGWLASKGLEHFEESKESKKS